MDLKLVHKVWQNTCRDYREISGLSDFNDHKVNKVIKNIHEDANDINDDWSVGDPEEYQDVTDNILGGLDDVNNLNDLVTILKIALKAYGKILQHYDDDNAEDVKKTNQELLGK